MSKRNWFIGGFAVLFFIIVFVYFFFPSDDVSDSYSEKERKVSFLEVDSFWADSVLKTMSVEEKAAMIILYELPKNLSGDSAFNAVPSPGGYVLSLNHFEDKYSKDVSKSLLFASFNEIPFANKKIKWKGYKSPQQFSVIPNAEMLFSITQDTILKQAVESLIKNGDYYQLDAINLPLLCEFSEHSNTSKIYKKDTAYYRDLITNFQTEFTDQHFLAGSGMITTLSTVKNDSIRKSVKSYSKNNFPLFYVDSMLNPSNLKKDELTIFLNDEYKFKGLCIAYANVKTEKSGKALSNLINAGVDLIQTNNFSETYLNLIKEIKGGNIRESILDSKIKKILMAKTWSNLRRKKLNYQKTEDLSVYERTFHVRFSKASFTLVKNKKDYLPIRNITNNRIILIQLGKQIPEMVNEFYHYLPKEQTVLIKSYKTISESVSFNPNDYKKYNTVVVTIHENINKNTVLLDKLKTLSSSVKLIILNFSHAANLKVLSDFSTVIQFWNDTFIEHKFGAQSIFGAVEFNARLPIQFHPDLKLDKSIKLSQSRLQYILPEEIGISSDSLLKIDYIVEEGIRNRAFPGAQVFFALEGKVFYNRSFGTHIYNDKQEVKTDDLFDMASVTKVASSTIVAMSAYEKGYFKLNDSLWKHLPDTLKKHLRSPSSLRNITFKQILTHETGLAAGQPILRYIKYRDTLDNKIGRFDRYFCDEPDEYYCVPVADKFYLEREQLDTIWYAMNRMKPDENPDYRYSDANMNLLYKLLDSKIKNRWRFYLDSLFYKPMGMFNTCYLPIENEIKPERIVPTENDRYWRKQLLRGYVHDPTAALFGGVAGNAGLFSTAEDIGILFQMLLFNGNYGGVSYFKKETVDLFTSQQSGSHRGLGFNRQVKGNMYGCSPYASNNTFGHTGFTGISVWADKDIQLIYVSCTNRVHPDPDNKKIINLGTTKRIHNVVYEQLKYVMPDKISLEY